MCPATDDREVDGMNRFVAVDADSRDVGLAEGPVSCDKVLELLLILTPGKMLQPHLLAAGVMTLNGTSLVALGATR